MDAAASLNAASPGVRVSSASGYWARTMDMQHPGMMTTDVASMSDCAASSVVIFSHRGRRCRSRASECRNCWRRRRRMDGRHPAPCVRDVGARGANQPPVTMDRLFSKDPNAAVGQPE